MMSPQISVELIAQLLCILQIFMALDGPKDHYMRPFAIALPITSKPIESTAEKLAWQAWLLLPPEQKSQIKSRKVTPKSIFILPLRGDCPPDHQKVDSKCIPIVTGSNSVLIDPNVLSLVVGDTGSAIDFDYGEEDGDVALPPAIPSLPSVTMPLSVSNYSAVSNVSDDFHVEQSTENHKDEPLKFNIFQNKYPTDYDLNEDYLIVSGEGESISTEDDSIALATADGVNASVLQTNSTSLQKEDDFKGDKSNTQSLGIAMDDLVWPVLGLEPEDKPRRITMTKDDSAIQYSSHVFDQENDAAANETLTPIDITELLQNEALMPILNSTQQQTLETNRTSAVELSGRDEIMNSTDVLLLNIDTDLSTFTSIPLSDDDRTDTIEIQADRTDYLLLFNGSDKISKLPTNTADVSESKVDGVMTDLAKQFQNYFLTKVNDNKTLLTTVTAEPNIGNETKQSDDEKEEEQQQRLKLKVEQLSHEVLGEPTTTIITKSRRKDQENMGTKNMTITTTTTTTDNQTTALTPLSSDQQTKRIEDRFHYQHLKSDHLLVRNVTNPTISTTIKDGINPLKTAYETSSSPTAPTPNTTIATTNSYLINGVDNATFTNLHSSHINPTANDRDVWSKVKSEKAQPETATNFTAFIEGNYDEISNSYQTTTNRSRLSFEPALPLSSVLALEGNWSSEEHLHAIETRSRPDFVIFKRNYTDNYSNENKTTNERTPSKLATTTTTINNKLSLEIDNSSLTGHQSSYDDRLAHLWWMPLGQNSSTNTNTNNNKNNKNSFDLKTQWQKQNHNNNNDNNDNKSKSESKGNDEIKSESSLEDSLLYRFWSKYHTKNH